MPKLILDQFTGGQMSRQTRYKLRRLTKGQCPTCAQPKEPGCATYACARCTWLNNERTKAGRDHAVLNSILDLI